jgi:4-hydroxy-tetrahydrodipicolinate synthase
MTKKSAPFALSGVIPAHVQPFTSDSRLDELGLRRHLRRLLQVPGLSGLTTNAHASEVASLTSDERRRQLDIVLEEVDGRIAVVAGIHEESFSMAASAALRAEDAGADALLILPPEIRPGGGDAGAERTLARYSEVASASSLPLVAFMHPATSGMRMSVDGIVRLCSEIDSVIAVQDWSNDIVVYERTWRALKSLDREVSVLPSFTLSLFSSLCIGADGILSGQGSMVAHLHVRLWDAINQRDLDEARVLWDRIWPLAETWYKDPFQDGHNRMKVALELLGEIDAAHVRPPLQPLNVEERNQVGFAIQESGLVRI